MRIFTVNQMRAAEEEAFKRGILPLRLMENAGAAFVKTLDGIYNVKGKKIAIVTGNSNNAGDGYVAARKLREYGASVSVIRAFSGRMSEQCSVMYKKCTELGISINDYGTDPSFCNTILDSANIIVDAIFGIGFHGTADSYTSQVFQSINNSKATVVALDIPSGLEADSGCVNSTCVKADTTITLAAAKYCQILPEASQYCGKLVGCGIGIPEDIMDMFGSVPETIEEADVALNLPERPKNSHKGTFGTAAFLCGSYGMAGAAILACKSAIRSGVGLTRLMSPKSIYSIVASSLAETVHSPLEETKSGTVSFAEVGKILKLTETASAVCIGCGMGKERYSNALVGELLKGITAPIVLDADGINAAADSIDIFEHKTSKLVLTPHPKELSRLLGVSVDEINNDRIGFAITASKRFGATVVLKGANTVVATEKGRIFVNIIGNSGMAKAGSGDILAGIITALIAQGVSPDAAACMGVFIHAKAGDICADNLGERSMCVEDMINALAVVFKSL